MPPEGKYSNVKAVNILSGPGALSGGTGTLNSNGVLSCGQFPDIDLPKVGDHYNITGSSDTDKQMYTFTDYECVNRGATSDFKASKTQSSRGQKR